MPKRKKHYTRKIPGAIPDPSLDPNPGPEPIGQPPVENELMFSEAKGEDRIRVQRADDYTKKDILHGYLIPDEATEAKLAEIWGGGRYSCCHIASNETGSRVVKDRKIYTVLGAYKRPAEILGLASAPVPAPVAPGIVDVVGLQRAGAGLTMSPNEALSNVLLSQVLDVVKTTREGKMDWAAIIPGVLGVVEAYMARPKDEGILTALRDLGDRMTAIQQRPAVAAGSLEEGLKHLALLKEAMRNDPETDKEPVDPVVGMVKPLLELLQHQQAVKGSEPAPKQIPSGQEIVAPLPLWQQMLLRYRGTILQFARRGVEPDFTADTILRLLDSDLEGVLAEFVQRPDAAQIAAQVLPELQSFPTWTDGVFAALKTGMEPEPDEPEKKGKKMGG